jgi:hypothetical protein
MAKKIKYNSKRTKIKCLHGNHSKPVNREEAIFCSALCRVQEENYRKQIGMAKLFIETSYESLRKEYLDLWIMNTSFQKDFIEIATAFKTYGSKENWKYLNASNRFIIYFSQHSKTKNFKLYYNQELDKQFKDIKKRFKICNSKNQTFKYVR